MNHMIKITDFSECQISSRAGTYGGKAGYKDGILYKDEYWIIKYPQSTKEMRKMDMSYTTAPLSEYLGSQIYKTLGYDTHETKLGYRNGKIVVACKDFCKNEGALREIRTLKNFANQNLAEMLDRSFGSTGQKHAVNLEETLLHLQYNDILSKVPGITERFWDMAVIDIFINNNDRNNGNWGILYEDGKYRLAPVYDNGASFSNKLSDQKITEILKHEDRIKQSVMTSATAFELDGKQIFANQMLTLPQKDLQKAIIKNVPLIIEKADEINKIFENIPEQYHGLYICSKERKEFYLKSMNYRMYELLIPEYNKYAEKQINPDISRNLFHLDNDSRNISLEEVLKEAAAMASEKNRKTAHINRDRTDNFER